jgi:hypothetical protein
MPRPEDMPKLESIKPEDKIYIKKEGSDSYIKVTVESNDEMFKLSWLQEDGALISFYKEEDLKTIAVGTSHEFYGLSWNYIVFNSEMLQLLLDTGKNEYNCIVPIFATKIVTFNTLKTIYDGGQELNETDIEVGYIFYINTTTIETVFEYRPKGSIEYSGIVTNIDKTTTPVNYTIELSIIEDDAFFYFPEKDALRDPTRISRPIAELKFLDKFTVRSKYTICRTSEDEYKFKNFKFLYPKELLNYYPKDINGRLFYSPNYVISPKHYIYDRSTNECDKVEIIEVDKVLNVRSLDHRRYIAEEVEIVLPPINVRKVERGYVIQNGTHRLDFSKRMGYKCIPAIVA